MKRSLFLFILALWCSPLLADGSITGGPGTISGGPGTIQLINITTPSGKAFTLVQSSGIQDTSAKTFSVSSFTATTATGSLLMAFIGDGGATLPTSVFDDRGNVYYLRTDFTFGEGTKIYASTSTIGGAHYIRANYAGTDTRAFGIAEFTGPTASTGTSFANATNNLAAFGTSTTTLAGFPQLGLCTTESDTAGVVTYTGGDGWIDMIDLGAATGPQLHVQYKVLTKHSSCSDRWSAATATSRSILWTIN